MMAIVSRRLWPALGTSHERLHQHERRATLDQMGVMQDLALEGFGRHSFRDFRAARRIHSRLVSVKPRAARWATMPSARSSIMLHADLNSENPLVPAPDPRPSLAVPDDDPHIWLEDVEGEGALAWVESQNAKTLHRFGDARFAADRDVLTTILDRPDNIPFVRRRGRHVYNFWRDAANPRGLWRRTTLDDFRADAPTWEVLPDLDALAAAEGEDWLWAGASTLPGVHDRAVLRLSRGGGDAVVLREFDIPARAFIADGFVASEAKGGVAWLDRDTLLLSSALGGGSMATRSGYPRTVRLWHRGTDPHEARVVFEVDPEHMVAWGDVDRSGGAERVWFADRAGFFETTVWLGDRDGPTTRLELPADAQFEWHRDWLAVKPRTPWTVGGVTHPTDTVLGIAFSAFLAGDRRFTPLFAPADRRVLRYFFWSGGRLVLAILDDLRPEFETLTPSASAGRGRLSKGCRRSARRSFGRSTSRRTSRPASCWRTCRTR
jgi:prolyl oligopeptidase